MSKVLSAVAWPYANGPRHIGHVAGFGVPSDVFSRYMRMAGHDVLMVSGTDEHGTPILIAADEAGVSAAGAGRPEPPADRRGPRRRSGSPTTSTPAPPRATTTRSCRSCSSASTTTATSSSRRRTARSRRPPGAPCPTATSRAPARSAATTSARGDQCDNCGNQLDPTDLINPRSQDQRRDAGVHRDPALLPRPAGAGRGARGVARRARGVRDLAAERDPVQPEHPRGDPAAGDDPRHRLGHPGAARRLARQPDQEALRLVRRGDRLPVGVDRVGASHAATPRRGASGGTTRRRCPTTSWARTTSPSTARSGPPSCSPTPARAPRAASPHELRRAQPAHRGRQLGVPHDGGQEVLLLASRS